MAGSFNIATKTASAERTNRAPASDPRSSVAGAPPVIRRWSQRELTEAPHRPSTSPSRSRTASTANGERAPWDRLRGHSPGARWRRARYAAADRQPARAHRSARRSRFSCCGRRHLAATRRTDSRST